MNITTLETYQTNDARHSQVMIEGEYGTLRAYLSEHPDAPESAPAVINRLGFLQSPRDPSVRAIHHDVFEGLGASRLLTVGNNGIDIEHGTDIASGEQTASDNYELLCRFAGASGVFLVANSMGVKNTIEMLHPTVDSQYKAPVRGMTWVSPGAVHPAYALERCSKLPINLLLTGSMWVLMNPARMTAYYGPHLLYPGRAANEITELPHIGFRFFENNQPVQHHRRLTEKGTHPDITHAVAETYSGAIHVIAGTDDVMYDKGTFARTPHIRRTELSGGHEIGILPPIASRLIIDSIVQFQNNEAVPRAKAA